jgi:hypothetical protein
MQHLDTDRLAALADETPSHEEAAHLASCLACREEIEAYVSLLDLARQEGLAGLDPGLPSPLPITSWDTIGAALKREGLVQAPAAVRSTPVPRRLSGWGRLAASVALLVGGAALGRATASTGVTATPAGDRVSSLASAEGLGMPLAGGSTTGSAITPGASATPSAGISDSIPVAGEPRAAFAKSTAPDLPYDFTDTRTALQVLTRASRDYQRAAAFLAEHDTGSVAGTPQILRARLAALDEVMPKVREALYEAPQDPVLNQYYLTTYEARESTLRQLGRALPVGVRLNGY